MFWRAGRSSAPAGASAGPAAASRRQPADVLVLVTALHLPIVTQSELRTYRRCPREWRLAYGLGLRSLAMGDTLRGAATEAEGPLLNPSGMAVTQKFQVSGFYSLRLPSQGHNVHLSIVDSVTNRRLAIGLYYSFTQELPRFAFPLAEGPYADGTPQRVILVDGGTDVTVTASSTTTSGACAAWAAAGALPRWWEWWWWAWWPRWWRSRSPRSPAARRRRCSSGRGV